VDHPLVHTLRRAVAGAPPPPDGVVEVLPPPPGPVDAVIGFTAHLIVAAAVPAADVQARLPDGDLGAWMAPAFLEWMGERLSSRATSHDLVLAAAADPGLCDELECAEVGDLDHPRVQEASRYRTDVRVFTDTDDQGILVLGRGLAGRWEFAFEVEPAGRNRGLGRRLALVARSLIPEGDPLFAQVAPGNAASVRAVLAAGFRPIGSEVLFPRVGPPAG
jgi:hypothetical protein